MSDIVAQLQVLSQETGCFLDLTAILNASICPQVNIKSLPQHYVQEEGEYICVTSTEQESKRDVQQCEECFQVNNQVCSQNTVALDLELLILLGLITEEDLELYLKQLGVTPTSSSSSSSSNNNKPPSSVNSASPTSSMAPQKTAKIEPLLSLNAGGNSLANLNVGGKGKNSLLDLSVGKNGQLLGLTLDGKKVLSLRDTRKKLLDVQVGGEPKHDADIDVNVLTHRPNMARDEDCEEEPYLTHYQPVCNKGFKQQQSSQAQRCHAVDVNHCLAICNSQAALKSIGANGMSSDGEVLVCNGVEFNSSTGEDNCGYFVGSESEACEESQLEESENCYTFIRN